MSAVAAAVRPPTKKPGKSWFANPLVRAVISIAVFIGFWEIASRLNWPWIGQAPAPTKVLDAWIPLLTDQGYWYSWYQSSRRVLSGFIAAMVIGIPFGLAMATSRVFNDVTFPVFEILRPVPPLAWVPAAIIFWPTQELSIEDFLPQAQQDGSRRLEIADWSALPDDQVLRGELRGVIDHAIEQLPEIYRAVITLRDIEEMSTEETAQVLDVTQEVVKTRLHRARLAVRQKLDEYLRSVQAAGTKER